VKYLPDVKALIALGFLEHSLRSRVARWVRGLARGRDTQLINCPFSEPGFIRVLSQAPQCGFADDHDAGQLPGWVKTAKQTTNGHLAELARAHGAIPATLDERIPGAFVIQE